MFFKTLFVTGFLLCLFFAAKTQTKHALIFAVGNYPKAGGWSTISSLKDVALIKQTFQQQGINDIRVYTDSQVTMTGIRKAFVTLQNDATVQKGDVVVIHISSHGEQVKDDTGDETDGLDEAIVTYQAKCPAHGVKLTNEEYQKFQAEYFRDDEFGDLLNGLRAKLGVKGDVVVFIDACHSGTGTRGYAKVRGGMPPLVPGNFNFNNYGADTAGVFNENKTAKSTGNDLASYVVISAARAEELNYETTGDDNESMGSLSYAMVKAFKDLKDGTSYRSLFARIQSVMNIKVPNQQHPVMEGNGTDRLLFGGGYVKQQPYMEVAFINNKQARLKGGRVFGLDTGAKISFYPAGVIGTNGLQPLAKGTVTKTSNFTAFVTLDSAFQKQAVDIWAFITEPVCNLLPVSVSIPKTGGYAFSDAEIAAIKKEFKDLPYITFTDEKPVLLLEKNENTDTIRIAANGFGFSGIKSSNNFSILKAEVQRYAQYTFLKDIKTEDDNTNKLEIKLVPVLTEKADTNYVKMRMKNGVYEFYEGDTLTFWVKNNGDAPVYFNVLDLQPDGIINAVYPNTNRNDPVMPEDLRMGAGESRMFKRFIQISPPFGSETFKIFVSTDKINLEGLATEETRAMSRGNLKGLELLVKNSASLTRGAPPVSLGNIDGTIYDIVFEIKMRK